MISYESLSFFCRANAFKVKLFESKACFTLVKARGKH